MLELIINGIFIGMGTAIGTPIGLFLYESKVKPWLLHYDSFEKKIKSVIHEEMKNGN